MPHPSDSITISSWPHSSCDSLPGLCRAVQAIPPSSDGQQHWGKMVNLGFLPSVLGKECAGRKPHVMPTGLSGPGCSLPFGNRPGEKRSQGAGRLFPAGESHVSRSSPATTATYRCGKITQPEATHHSSICSLFLFSLQGVLQSLIECASRVYSRQVAHLFHENLQTRFSFPVKELYSVSLTVKESVRLCEHVKHSIVVSFLAHLLAVLEESQTVFIIAESPQNTVEFVCIAYRRRYY